MAHHVFFLLLFLTSLKRIMIEYLNDNDNEEKKRKTEKKTLKLCMWNLSMWTMRVYLNITHALIYPYSIKVIIDYTRENK